MNSWPRAAKAGVEACKYSCCCFVSSVKCNHAITTSTTASPDTGTILKATRSTSCWSAKLGYRPSNLIPTSSGHVATELQKQEAGDLSVNLLISDDAAIVLKDAPDTRLSCPVNLEIPCELLQHSQTPAPAAPPMPAIQRRRRRGKSRRGRADKAAATAAAAAVPAATTRIAHDCHVSADIPSFCQDNPGAATTSCVSDEADACPCVQSRLPLTSPQPRVEVHAVTGDVLILEPPVDNLQHLFESVDHALSVVPGLSADDVALRRETAASPLLAVGLHSVIPTAPSLPVDACPFVPALPTAGAACPFSSLIPESPVEIRLAASGPYSQAEAGMDLSAANRQATMASSALRADARPFVPLVAPTLFIAEEEAAAAEAAAVPAATTRTAHDCHVSADIPSLCQDNAGAATASCVSDEADACPCVQSRLTPTSPQLRVEVLAATGDSLLPEQRSEEPFDKLQAQVKVILITHNSVCNGNCCCCFLGLASSLLTVWQLLLLWQLC